MKRNIIYTFLLAAALVFTACGSDSKIDPVVSDSNASLPIDSAIDPILDPTLPIVDTTGMTLTAAPVEINIFTAKESQVISLYLSNASVPVANTNIKANFFDPNTGTLNSYSVATNEVGQAVFNYTAPVSLPASDLVITFAVENGTPLVSEDVTVKFDDSTVLPGVTVLPQVIVSNDRKVNILTTNNELVGLAIKVFDGATNAPYSEGNIKVELPSKVMEGIDVGSFTAYEVPIINGVATFNYTGPNNLQALVDNGDSNSTFLFYHEDNSIDKKQAVMIYSPDAESSYIPVNYELIVTSQDGNMTMGLNKEKTFSVVLKDDQGNAVSSSAMTSVQIKSKNNFVGKLLDNGVEIDTLVIGGQNPVNFNVKTNTKSGLLPIDITVDFIDPNGISKQMTQTVNIVVYSGPATAMSISYVGVEQDASKGKYIERFAVTLVDTYNNKVNTQPNIAVGGMIEYAVDGRSTTGERTTTSPRLWYGKLDTPHGSVVQIGGNQATFDTLGGVNIFRYVDFANDTLVVFGEGYVYEALGKWDIAPGSTLNSLELLDDYFGIRRDNLFYAVGHNKRQDLCSTDGTEYVGAAKSDTYQIDNEGTALIEFEYDYHLTGKDIMLWVNLSGYQADTDTETRIGEAKEHTLRGNGFITPNTYTLAAGSGASSLYFGVKHKNAPEHYKNGHFGYSVTGKCTVENVISSSNLVYDVNGVAISVKDARSCDNGGVVYIELNVSNPTTGDCTISLDNILVAGEF